MTKKDKKEIIAALVDENIPRLRTEIVKLIRSVMEDERVTTLNDFCFSSEDCLPVVVARDAIWAAVGQATQDDETWS
jgi:hypothetical protein